jgi:hypothetical protein
MAIEALLADDDFEHHPHHDLESILYVILYICTFTEGPNKARLDFNTPDTLAMKAWFTTDTLREIGSRKLADMSKPISRIIPGFTWYWKDFAPFALELIGLCGQQPTCSKLTHKEMLSVLHKACMAVKESPTSDMPVPVGAVTEEKNLKRSKPSDTLDDDEDDPPVRPVRKMVKI